MAITLMINKYSALDKLCVTGWTVRALCFQKVIDNYPLLAMLVG